MQACFFIHANAGIANAHSHVLANGNTAGGSEYGTQQIFCCHKYLAAAGHSVARIDDDVEDDLFEVCLVNHHSAGGAQVYGEFNVLPNQPGKNGGKFLKRFSGLQRYRAARFPCG